MVASAAGKNAKDPYGIWQGKGVTLASVDFVNTGKSARGLKLQVSGKGIDSGRLSNLVAVVEAEGAPENTYRKVIHLHKDSDGSWSGDGDMPIVSQQASGLVGQGTCTQHLTLTLHGDASPAGTADFIMDVIPKDAADGDLKTTITTAVKNEHADCETLYDAPPELQLSGYPGAKFNGATRTMIGGTSQSAVSYTVTAEYQKIHDFYKNELVRCGYQIEKEHDILGVQLIEAHNSINHLEIETNSNREKGEFSVEVKIVPEADWLRAEQAEPSAIPTVAPAATQTNSSSSSAGTSTDAAQTATSTSN